ncbi:MAG: hypothetical protein KGO05_15230, partial [Chloroflexota bacterium]|nr:hypothetical protein [Chloroflexota bacterium]
ERMYRWGKVYLPEDLIERVTGARPSPSHFVEYLTRKFEGVYGLPAAPLIPVREEKAAKPAKADGKAAHR